MEIKLEIIMKQIHPDYQKKNTIEELVDAIVKNAEYGIHNCVDAFASDVRDCLIRAQQIREKEICEAMTQTQSC